MRDPKEFTKESFVAHASPVMTTIVNEGFFADVVVVVEGVSDASALWALQDIQSRNWDALGISVVPTTGKNSIDRPVVVFRGLGIPTYFVFDGDSRHSGTAKQDKTVQSNHLLLRLAGVATEDFPMTAAFPSWAVFNDQLESEIKLAIGVENFDRIRQAIADKLVYDQPSAVMKNPEGVSKFVRMVYAEGKHIPILEDIVARITALRPP